MLTAPCGLPARHPRWRRTHAQARSHGIAGNAEIPPTIHLLERRAPGPGRQAQFGSRMKKTMGTARAPKATRRPLPGAQPGDAAGRPWATMAPTGWDRHRLPTFCPSIGRGPVLRWRWGHRPRDGSQVPSRLGTWAQQRHVCCCLCLLARSTRAERICSLT